MARRKKVVEETPKDDIIPADEAIREELQAVEDKKASEFLEAPVKNGEVVEEAPKDEKKDEKPEEKPEGAEEVPENAPKTPEEREIEIDPDKMTAEIADRVTKALGSDKKATPAEKDRYQEFAEKFAKEKGRNPTWFELVPFIKDEVRSELKKEQEAEAKTKQDQENTMKKRQQEYIDNFNKFVTSELDELTGEEKLPKVENPKDKNDRGFLARQALIKTGAEVNEKLRAEGKPLITSIYKIYHKYNNEYKANLQEMIGPAGADVPVSAGRGNAQPQKEEEYSYDEIHRNSFVDLFRRK